MDQGCRSRSGALAALETIARGAAATTGSANASATPDIAIAGARCASSRGASGIVAMADFPASARTRARGAAGIPDDRAAVHPAGVSGVS
jgi:hypothetical protein